MLSPGSNIKIYLCTGLTDMRKGVHSLAQLADSILTSKACSGAMFVFRGRSADKIKILWWDGQGFCMFYKCMDSGKFVWPKDENVGSLGITRGQLAMLIEGIDWRNPKWSEPPVRVA